MSNNIIPVHAEIRVPYGKGIKYVNYSIDSKCEFPKEDGTIEVDHFQDHLGRPVRLHITRDFSFNLDLAEDKHNYKLLVKRLEFDPELDSIIKVFDDNRDVDKMNDMLLLKIDIMNRISDLYKNENNNKLASIYRILRGSAKGVAASVVYKHIMDEVERKPEKVLSILEDSDFEIKSIIANSVEKGFIQLEDGFYKSQTGKVLASGEDKMVFYLEENQDVLAHLKSLMAMKSDSKSKEPLILSKIEKSDEEEQIQEIESVSGVVDKMLAVGVVEVTPDDQYKLTGRRAKYKTIDALVSYFDKNPKEYDLAKSLAGLTNNFETFTDK